MTLKLAGELALVSCPECGGLGRVPCPATIAVRTGVNGFNHGGSIQTPGYRKPIPCPVCKGKKVVPA